MALAVANRAEPLLSKVHATGDIHPLGNASAIFPYDHPAIFSMTAAFVVTWLGSVTDKSDRAAKEIDAFEAQYIRAQTGLGAAGASNH